LGGGEENSAFFGDQDILLQADIAIARHHQAGFEREDLANFEGQERRPAIAIPGRAKDRSAVMRQTADLVAGGIFIFRIARARHDGPRGPVNRHAQRAGADRIKAAWMACTTVLKPLRTGSGGWLSPGLRK